MNILLQCLAVGFAGSLGALSRLGLARLVDRYVPEFPLGTMIINVTGCFILGWFVAHMSGRVSPGAELWRVAIATGFIGAYTTFSTWILESNRLVADGADLKFAVNVIGSLALGLLAVRLGAVLGSRV